MVGIDIHSEPGIIKVNQRLTKESGTTVTDFVTTMVPCSDGNTYMFGTGGNIYKRDSSWTYTLLATIGAIYGAAEYDGYIYYATSTTLGRWQIGTSWSTRTDSWQTFTNTTTYRPMHALNLVLYIGNGYLVDQVRKGVFTASAVDLEKQYTITCLWEIGLDLAIWTTVANNVSKTRIFRWNGWSQYCQTSDEIPEVGINAFIATDNYVLVSAGKKGNLYTYNGETLERFKRIPGNWAGTNTIAVSTDASSNLNGLPIFWISYDNGTIPTVGVYSLGSYSNNYPSVLNLEYTLSNENITTANIGSIKVVGNDVLVSWKTGSSYGIDKIDTTLKRDGAYITTRQVNVNREERKANFLATAAYRTLPIGTSLELQASVNNAAFVTLPSIVDAIRKTVYTQNSFPAGSSVVFKLIFRTTANLAPEVESFKITL